MKFQDITAARPSRDSLDEAYRAVHALLDDGERREAIARWDETRRGYETWSSLTYLHFSQDTANPEYKAARAYSDEMGPVATEFDTRVKRRLLDDPDRRAVEAAAGAYAVRLWESDVTTFDPAIAKDLEEEAKLDARYTEILAGAKIEFDGKTLNLAGLTPYTESPDRETRHAAEAARWEFFAGHGAELDEIYDRQVRLRHKMARTLGFDSFTPLGYRRMRRTDYDAADVATYRDQVAEHVVPLVARLVEQRRAGAGWDRVMFWDERLIDPEGNPKPEGDHDRLVAAANTMFERMDGRLAAFYRQMNEGGFMDLKNRPTKAGGGFCTSFPSYGMPYIFANFNGTHHDIDVFTHEMGHAFQNYESRNLPGIDYLWPTSESAEIHSMSLEFLAYPHIEPLLGAQSDRYRRMHLIQALEFLPYGVLVDHFQHEVYANPEATAAERHEIWRRLEQRYLPWRDYGDLAYPAKGGRWQAQGHIYGVPFYYIDYTLAQCCALQFWVKSQADYGASMESYVRLCGLGGSAPFGELVGAAGLVSPFKPGALSTVVATAAGALAA
jgi:M3 family oligoendopeptidase